MIMLLRNNGYICSLLLVMMIMMINPTIVNSAQVCSECSLCSNCFVVYHTVSLRSGGGHEVRTLVTRSTLHWALSRMVTGGQSYPCDCGVINTTWLQDTTYGPLTIFALLTVTTQLLSAEKSCVVQGNHRDFKSALFFRLEYVYVYFICLPI